MLKFIKHHMETIVGIEIYPLISFVIFFAFFIGLTIYVIRVSKSQINYVSKLPLDSNQDNHEQA